MLMLAEEFEKLQFVSFVNIYISSEQNDHNYLKNAAALCLNPKTSSSSKRYGGKAPNRMYSCLSQKVFRGVHAVDGRMWKSFYIQ